LRYRGLNRVLICAYSCPSLIKSFEAQGIEVVHFDLGEPPEFADDWLAISTALFGGNAPLIPGYCLVDASHTAFAHNRKPKGYAILSSPRKTTSLPDGAILRGPDTLRGMVSSLPLALQSVAYKTTARTLWHNRNNELALWYNGLAEDAWPTEPCRLSPESLWKLERLDIEWHETRRKENYRVLEELLEGIPHHHVSGVPYCYPILVKNRDETLEILHFDRIYSTKLWWDAKFDRERFPVSARYADELICLPVDQRHTASDMQRIADAVRSVAEY